MTRMVLNTIVTVNRFPDVSKHLLIKSFTKGVFSIKTPKSRYTYSWSNDKILARDGLGNNDELANKGFF